MFSSTGVPALSSEWTNWHLLFARQPEPDLEFSEEDLDESVPPPAPPMNAPKRSGKRPLLWILLLLVVGGIGYVAMDPDGAMQLIEPYLEDGTETAQPVPRTPPNNTQAPTVIPPELIDRGSSAPADPAPAPPVMAASATPPVKPAPAFVNVAGPQFSEGQRVTVIPDPNRPQSPVPLFVDAAGTKTSTTVQASATLTVLDGDYQKPGWVYVVRTEDGRKGWIPERGLKLKR
ncbi:MAG: SH3 domain-containing protein [Nitrospira defluvii]|nr:SH3 domain-containing protein [Nitrospira defluvii]